MHCNTNDIYAVDKDKARVYAYHIVRKKSTCVSYYHPYGNGNCPRTQNLRLDGTHIATLVYQGTPNPDSMVESIVINYIATY
jgi:hypothetical protein